MVAQSYSALLTRVDQCDSLPKRRFIDHSVWKAGAVIIPLMAQISMAETSLASDDVEGWTLVTRQKPRKSKQTHAPLLCRRRRRGKKKKNPQHARNKKRLKTNKRHEIHPTDLLEQELLVPVMLEELFLVGFFDKIIANMTSCYEMEDEEERDEEKLEKPLESEEKALTILKALSACTNWRQIFNLLEDIC